MKYAKLKKVKIVATLGPASFSPQIIEKLIQEGVDVFRINMSHSSAEVVDRLVRDIRAAEKKMGTAVAILGDLMGPKIRIGDVEPGTELVPGKRVTIVSRAVRGTSELLSLNFPTIIRNLRPGHEIYIGDGNMKLVVEQHTKDGVVARVLVGGPLLPRKGFSAHGMTLKQFALTKKDKEDIDILLRVGVDAIAISFVQSPKDIEAVRRLIPKKDAPLLIAKIETAAAAHEAERILAVSDGLMVARGDLGLAVPIAEVPHIQKALIDLCLRRAKPVITATQMLDSMVQRPLPTRAEVTDVANAILDGTDAVMLSDETATGKFPIEAVRTMAQIIERASLDVKERDIMEDASIAGAISKSVVRVAHQIDAKLIVVLTEQGATARRVARHRYQGPIVALCPNTKTIRALRFVWGVYGYMLPAITKDMDDLLLQTASFVSSRTPFRLQKGDLYVISAGMPFGRSGTTNMVLVEEAK